MTGPMRVKAPIISRRALGRYTPDVLRIEPRELPTLTKNTVRHCPHID